MRPDKFTQNLQSALGEAQSIALGRDHQFIEPLHLMLALLQQQGTSMPHVLNSAGVDASALKTDIENKLNTVARVQANGDIDIGTLFNPNSSAFLGIPDFGGINDIIQQTS